MENEGVIIIQKGGDILTFCFDNETLRSLAKRQELKAQVFEDQSTQLLSLANRSANHSVKLWKLSINKSILNRI